MGKKELLRKPDILSCSIQYSFSKQTNTLIHQKRTLQNTLLNDFYFIIIHRDTLTYENGLYSYLWKWPLFLPMEMAWGPLPLLPTKEQQPHGLSEISKILSWCS